MSHSNRPTERFEPRPFASQTKVSFDAPSTIVYDKKFDTALRASQIEQHYKRVRSENPTLDDKLTESLENYPRQKPSDNVSCSAHARIMLSVYNLATSTDHPRLFNRKVPARTNRLINLAFDNIEIQMGYLLKNNKLPNVPTCWVDLKNIRQLEVEDLGFLNLLFDYGDWLLGVINASNAMYADYYKTLSPDEYIMDLSKRNVAHYPPLELTISWSHNFCVIKHGGISVLLPKAYILMLHNKVSDLLSILMYAKIARHSSMPTNFLDKVIDMCVELWQLVTDHGQDGFTIAKCLEAFASAETLTQVEQWNNTEFLNVVCKDLYLDTGFDYKTSNMRQIWRKDNPATMHELACLSKIAGHPLVDMEAGVQTIHKYTTEEYELNYDKINECICYTKQNYIRNFILRYGRWPKHEITSSVAANALKYGSLLNLDPEGYAMKNKYGSFPIQHYTFVELGQEMKFNKLENVIPHLKDKTISALRSRVLQRYINQQDTKITWVETRLLLYYLTHTGDDNDHVEFLNQYASGVSMDEFIDYLVIRIVPKEKEMKVKFRGFGCTTFPNRMGLLAQEKNAMAYLDLFCDEQAMTLSELDIVQRLFAFRSLIDAYPRHVVLYIMVDASKWNNHFRRETVDLVMEKTLDPVFGTQTFSRTHERYENTLFYVPDGDVTYYWEGQSGGIEGLNQDTWVSVYIPQIKTAMSDLDLRYHTLCKGDDLRLAVLVPLHDERVQDLAELKNTIMARLSNTAKSLGHDIKIYDSYGSTRYFNFSKAASVDKIEMPQGLRKIQKCYGATNAFLPTLDDYVGSTFSNAHSTCRVTTNVLPCFFTALSWAYYYLLTDEPRIEEKKNDRKKKFIEFNEQHIVETSCYSELSDKQLLGLLLVPSSCGGFPIIHMHNMLVRAESDLFPAFLDILSYVKESNQIEIFETMRQFLYFDGRRKVSWKPIYMDMYALPINKPATATFILRTSMVTPLRSSTHCEELEQLFDLIDDNSGSEAIIKCLDSCKDIPAKIFSVIYANLPESILGEILKKFETARSVLELLILRKGKRYSNKVLRRALAADVNVNKWRLGRVCGLHGDYYTDSYKYLDECPAKFAYKIREVYWSKPVEGITMPPMSHLVGFCTMAQGNTNDHIRGNHFILRIDHPKVFIPRADMNYHFGEGKKRPFLGHRTGTGTVNPVLHLVEKDKFLSNLRNLAELASWIQTSATLPDGTRVDSNLYQVIGKIVKLYTKEDLETFAPFLGSRKSGTIAHHIRTRHFRESIVPNTLSNVYQFVEGESNTHRKFFGDHGHYWINFLQMLSHGVSIATWELNSSPFFTTPGTVWMYTNDCQFCMREVVEDPVVVNLSLIKRVQFPQLQMLKMGSGAMSVLYESLDLAKTRQYNIEGNELELTVEQATAGTLKMVMEMSVDTTMRLTDRFTQHPGNRSGTAVLKAFAPKTRRRVIGQRELSCLSNDVLCNTVPLLITQLMLKHLKRSTICNLPDSLHSIPPSHLPWFELIHELSRVGRLHHLTVGIAEIADRYPTYLTYKPEQVSAYLGVVSLEAIAKITSAPELIILSDYEVTDTQRHLKDHLYIMSWTKFISDIDLPSTAAEKMGYALHATLRDHVISRLSMNESTVEEMTATGTYELARLYDIDAVDECLAQLLDIYDFAELIDAFDYRHYLYLHHIKKPEVELLGLYDSNREEFHHEVHFWILDASVTITCTTALACLTTLRSDGVPFRSMDDRPDDYHVDQHSLKNRLSLIAAVSRYTIIIPYAVDNPDVSEVIMDQPVIRENMYLPLSSHLWRPYGSHNSTTNHLMWIFNSLGVNPDCQFSGLSLCALGDGMGNGTLFFVTKNRNMRIVFTTKPDDQMLHIQPVVAMAAIKHNKHMLYAEHIRDGIWDLTDTNTFQSLYRLYQRHDVYFCDAELSSDLINWVQIWKNVCEYYVTTRKEQALLIIQVSTADTESLGRCCSFLAARCMFVAMSQPPSISDPQTYYLVAQGERTACLYMEVDQLRVSARIASVLRDFIVRQVASRNKERSATESRVNLRVKSPRMKAFASYFPPLWISSYTHDLGKSITEAYRVDLCSKSSAYPDIWKMEILQELDTSREATKLRHTLDNGSQHKSAQVRPYYHQDYHANRLFRIRRLFIHYGFNWALMMYRSGIEFILEEELKAVFIEVYESLPRRDQILPTDQEGIYSRYTVLESGLKVSYWGSFIRGIHIVQELISWLHVIQTRYN
uniref:RNA-directed RNA polymerase n=1 Tax=Atrato Chu-like virus 1 TaxID=2689322 RepID=A0A6B9KNJ3_9VIRU|nr:RdRp [Atrato Chu-like virus 1]